MIMLARWMDCFRLRSAAAVFVVCLLTAAAAGQPATANDPAQLLDDFVHYSIVAKPDLAAASAQALMGSQITDAELAILLDEGDIPAERFDRAVARSQRVPELSDVVAELVRRIEDGRLDLARDRERVEQAIQMLVGNQRQKLLATRRLEAAGEYAIPALLSEIVEGRDERLKTACVGTLRRIGRLAVLPLCEALPNLADPTNQRIVCDLLGEIGYPQAAPFLLELSVDETAAGSVQDAARRAFRRVGAVDLPLSVLYSNLAYQYFNNTASLVAYPYENANNVWTYDPFQGLVPTAVPTEVFGQVMAMRRTIKAVQVDASNSAALSVFVASNLKRENDLPPESEDPVYGDAQYTPAFYATVFGTNTCLDVLAMGLDNYDTPLIRDALDALEKTTSGPSLFGAERSRQPLLEALRYPDRRVQYEAALTLGRTLPEEHFPGDVMVVPLLASAVRTSNQSFALVLAADEEDQRVTAGRLEQLGFSVLGSASAVASLELAITEAVGIDLVVVRASSPEGAQQDVGDLRAVPKASAAPVLVAASGPDFPELKRMYRRNQRVKVVSWGTEEAFAAAVDDLLRQAAGGRMDEAEAEIYAIEALTTLRDIAVSRCGAYSMADAEPALIDALFLRKGGTRMLVAKILAMIDSPRAQRTLFDAAITAEGGEQLELLGYVSDSVKRFGSHAEPRHVAALRQLVADSTGELAEGAARVHGALNLPVSGTVDLLP